MNKDWPGRGLKKREGLGDGSDIWKGGDSKHSGK